MFTNTGNAYKVLLFCMISAKCYYSEIKPNHQPKERSMPTVAMKVNGASVVHDIPDNTLLVSFLRETMGLTGTHVGCDTSQCGACIVHVNGESIKSCSILAAQLDGADVTTIEGIANGDELHPMQQAFHENHGLQCGFCTPGMVMSAIELVTKNKTLSEREIREGLEGNICRCTGYHNIVKSVQDAAGKMHSA
jgi:carbon-monoxide dehydrogenase small subunit